MSLTSTCSTPMKQPKHHHILYLLGNSITKQSTDDRRMTRACRLVTCSGHKYSYPVMKLFKIGSISPSYNNRVVFLYLVSSMLFLRLLSVKMLINTGENVGLLGSGCRGNAECIWSPSVVSCGQCASGFL